ncbi:uncharacterized protein LAESUDRAFT_454068 [Laetiporus sulphureus 93-53]|uniref:Uncharacterized protein n=1 Tax=Laetiporus sulphureus 93-53 TaxID=1314785 RepID=A0A165BSH9_9APHY|nr:uncharacterized protein LAESUDRAFT_454068 [Laetiporus sulphureus 93-53]KZT01571.1 hypothetical protein LAESUDRAFT_454068 [Laetiporus sulphureus 93-53]
MTLTILVSFSLLALVVTARPIVSNDTPEVVDSFHDVQNAVQAIFESRTGESLACLSCDGDQDVHIHLTSSDEQDAYLARLQETPDAVKAVLPLSPDGDLSDDERRIYHILGSQRTSLLDDLDGEQDRLPELQKAEDLEPLTEPDATEESLRPSSEDAMSPSLLVLAISCIAALLAMLCIAVTWYLIRWYRSLLLQLGWDVLPQLKKGSSIRLPDDSDFSTECKVVIDRETSLSAALNEKSSSVSDEKVQPVQETSLLFTGQDVPEQPFITHPDPELLPLPTLPSPFPSSSQPSRPVSPSPRPSPLRRPLHMREVVSPSPISQPAWALRATDSPTLGLHSLRPTAVSSPRIPGALFDDDEEQTAAHRRAYRAPVPELDIAFALQLRPGLGVGADPAWLVRFLMAMFGWMTVLIGGGGARAGMRH